MSMSRYAFSLAVAALLVLSARAEAENAGASAERANQRPGRTMSLSQILDIVVRQSPDLARSRVDIASAEASALESEGLDDWQLSSTGAWKSNRTSFVPGQPFQAISDDALNFTAGLIRPLSTGGSIGLSLEGLYSDATYAVLGPTGRTDIAGRSLSSSVVATLSHPLLRGRGERIARGPQRRAQLARSEAELAMQVAALDTVQRVIEGYWELLYAERAVAIRSGSLALAREQLKLTNIAISGRVSARTEALAVRQSIAVREQEVMLAEIEVAERSLALRELAGLEVGPGEVLLHAQDKLTRLDRTISLDKALADARSANPSVHLARVRAENASLQVELSSDAMRSRLDVDARVGPNGNASEVAESLRQLAAFDGFTATANVTYQRSIQRRSARGALKQAVETQRRRRIDVAAVERQVSVAIVRAVNLVRSARKRVEVSEIAISLAQQNLDSEKILFKAGDTRSFDVLARQDELARARLSKERALVDLAQALAGVDALTGALLQRYRIDVIKPLS